MRLLPDFLRQLHQLGIQIWRDEEGFLGYRAPEGTLTPILLNELKTRKPELLQFLQSAVTAPATVIPQADRTAALPLSFAQERLWFASQYQGNNTGYNMPAALRLQGALDVAALAKSLQTIVERHESLRTTFVFTAETTDRTQAEGLVQQINPAHFTLAHSDLTDLTPAEQMAAVQRLALAEAQRPFDLAHDLLLRATLLRLSLTNHALLLTVHHIVSDGWSINLLLRELESLYTVFRQGKPASLPPLSIQYVDYAAWQRQWAQSAEALSQRDYWVKQLQEPTSLDLPTDHVRPPVQSNVGAVHPFTLSSALSAGLRALSKRQDCTLFITLLAAWQTLLYRYSGQGDILVGASIAGRNRLETEPLIGLFLNNLIYRSALTGELSFAQVLQQLRQTATQAYANQEYPFDQLINELQLPRDLSRNPLAQVRFAFHPQADKLFDLKLPGIEVSPIQLEWEIARFDLNLMVWEMGDSLYVNLAYSSDLFDPATIERMAGHWQILLEGLLANPAMPVAQLPLLRAAERQTLLVDWNQTQQNLPLDRCFHELFEEQVMRTPDAIAAVANNQSLTYLELNQRANRLAHLLLAHGLGEGEAEPIVPLLARRNLDFLTAMLAIFKAGGAYLPLDPRNPADRLRQVLTQCRARVVLVADELAALLQAALPSDEIQVLALEESLRQRYPTENLPNRSAPEQLAYTIFTSGSTGLPKGAMVEQRGMLNHLYAKVIDLELTAADRIAQTAPQSFDISVWQFLAALVVGGTVQIYGDEVALNPTLLLERVQADGITIWETVPSLMRALLDALANQPRPNPPLLREGIVTGQDNDPSLLAGGTVTGQETVPPLSRGRLGGGRGLRYPLQALRWLIPTGEALPPQLANQWLGFYPNIPLLNAYGPTECSDDVTHYAIRQPLPATMIHTPIGRPVVNMFAYILDSQMQPLPIGVPGELWIGGVGVGRGYLYDTERTDAAFQPNPFVNAPGARLYKTGDRARYLPDGNIEFLGRLDFQVKIRGFRIELGEIESALLQQPGVRECLVTVHEEAGEQTFKSLVAYVVEDKETRRQGNKEQALRTATLRNDLKQKLPEYMVPAFFVFLEAMPLTLNGKIDRKALPPPQGERVVTAVAFVEPETALERYLAEQWQRVLKVNKLGRHDNFFEIGGDSIRGAILINNLQQQFGEVLYVVALFDAPTLAKLADYLQQHYPAAVARLTGMHATTTTTRADKVDENTIAAFRRLILPLPPLPTPVRRKNRQAVFVLSAPRSGSTLFRVMLGGHPQLFSPPELDLLGFASMGERAHDLEGRFSFRREGLIRAVMELQGCDADAAKARLANLEAADLPMQAFYAHLQAWVGENRLLVDKTPIYALDPQTLRRAEAIFDEVHYIHLLRHPAAMIRSFEEARTDQVFFRQAHAFTPRQLAELVWTVSHQNILDFLQAIPAGRQHRVKYEELVADPYRTTQAICDFLHLPFAAKMAEPYADKEKRMTDGIYAVSKMLGDPKFHTHRQVDPNAAERWREQYTEDFIGEPTWQLAEQVGYSRPILQDGDGHGHGAVAAAAQHQHDASSQEQGWSPLAAIETRGSKPPFFCVHDVNGTVHSFYQLARALGSDQPFYGLQAVGMNDDTLQLASVEALASRYVDTIQQAQPHGPYQLGGYSLGCQIALEIARQLQGRGAKVAQLLLLDGRPPKVADGEGRMDRTQWLLYKVYGAAWRQGKSTALQAESLLAQVNEAALRTLPLTEQIAQLNQQLRAAQLVPLQTTEIEADFAAFDYLSRLQYQSPQAVNVPAAFFYTQGHFDLRYPLTQEPALGWAPFLPALHTCQRLPGDHLSMLFAPHVQEVAQQVADCLY